MPGSSTPVSRCPLKQLEVQDGLTNYCNQVAGSKSTLSLDNERLEGCESGILVLLIHSGVQLMISIRLTDLSNSPYGVSVTIAIDKASQLLCVNMPHRSQSVLATFEERRHFGLTVCILETCGFTVEDYRLTHFSSEEPPATHRSPAFGLNRGPGGDLGPRLSSITPLPGFVGAGGPGSYQDSSFASMFNPASTSLSTASMPQDTNQSPYATQHHGARGPGKLDGCPRLPPSSDHSTSPLSLDPYNIFSRKQVPDPYRPRVGSPLRYSVQPREPADESRTGIHAPVITQAIPEKLSPYQPYSPTSSAANHHLSSYTTPGPNPADHMPAVQSPSQRIHRSTSQPTPSTSRYEQSTDQQTKPAQNFRELMPRPRDLPFTKRQEKPYSRKTSPSKRETTTYGREQDISSSESGPSPTRARASYRDHGTSYDLSHASRTPDHPSRGPLADHSCTPPTRGQDESALSSLDSPAGESDTSASSPRAAKILPTILVADPYALKEAGNATTALLNQYQADIARGCDEATCAKFYAEQMHAARVEFWYSRLVDMRLGNWVASG